MNNQTKPNIQNSMSIVNVVRMKTKRYNKNGVILSWGFHHNKQAVVLYCLCLTPY